MDLGVEGEGGAVGGGAEGLDFLQGAGLLGAEVVAGEAEHDQALGPVGLLQLLQAGVLAGEAAAAGHIHDQQHLARQLAQALGRATGRGDDDIGDIDCHGFAVSGKAGP